MNARQQRQDAAAGADVEGSPCSALDDGVRQQRRALAETKDEIVGRTAPDLRRHVGGEQQLLIGQQLHERRYLSVAESQQPGSHPALQRHRVQGAAGRVELD